MAELNIHRVSGIKITDTVHCFANHINDMEYEEVAL